MAQKVVLLQLILYGEHNMNKEKKIKGNTAQKSSHNNARYDIIKNWINK